MYNSTELNYERYFSEIEWAYRNCFLLNIILLNPYWHLLIEGLWNEKFPGVFNTVPFIQKYEIGICRQIPVVNIKYQFAHTFHWLT